MLKKKKTLLSWELFLELCKMMITPEHEFIIDSS